MAAMEVGDSGGGSRSVDFSVGHTGEIQCSCAWLLETAASAAAAAASPPFSSACSNEGRLLTG